MYLLAFYTSTESQMIFLLILAFLFLLMGLGAGVLGFVLWMKRRSTECFLATLIGLGMCGLSYTLATIVANFPA